MFKLKRLVQPLFFVVSLLGLVWVLAASFAPRPATAVGQVDPELYLQAGLSGENNTSLVRPYAGDRLLYDLAVFATAPTSGGVVTATWPTEITSLQTAFCIGGTITGNQLVWEVGDFFNFNGCQLLLDIDPEASGTLTFTAVATADAFDPVNSETAFTQTIEVAVPTTLIVQYTAVADAPPTATIQLQTPAEAYYNWHIYASSGSNDGQFFAPSASAVDSAGNVYVVDGGNYRLQKFGPDMDWLATWGEQGLAEGQFDGVNDIALDSAGNVWVADQNNNRLQKFTNEGTHLQTVGMFGSDNGQFIAPWGLAINQNDNDRIYVADSQNGRVQVFSSAGAYQGQWGEFGNDLGQFSDMRRVTISPDGHVYVSDPLNSRVQKFTSEGVFVAAWGTAGNPNTAVDGFYEPQALSTDAQGNVYVVDIALGRVQKFSPTGDYLGSWGRRGSAPGQLGYDTRGVLVLPNGRILATETYNNRLQWFTTAALDPAVTLSDGETIAFHMPPSGSYTFTVNGASASWDCVTSDTAESLQITNTAVQIDLQQTERTTCTVTLNTTSTLFLPLVTRP